MMMHYFMTITFTSHSYHTLKLRKLSIFILKERKFQGTKVLGMFAPKERKFQGAKVPFHPWTFRSWEQKCRGTKSPSFVYYDMHKFSFSNRIIPILNTLLDYVLSSPTANTFKAHLDKFTENRFVK